MTAPAVYDSNFSVQLVEHEHKPEPIIEGDEIVCAVCRSPLKIVCPNGHAEALDGIRYSKGPVADAPRVRLCKCGNELEKQKQICWKCRAKAIYRTCSCGQVIEQPKKKLCNTCLNGRARRQIKLRKPIATSKVCRTCKVEKPAEDFAIVYAHYRQPDCRECKRANRKAGVTK